MFDLKGMKKDWKDNCINDRSFRCTDHSFFDDKSNFWSDTKQTDANVGDQNIIGSNIRHGVYAYSSKDWHIVRAQIIEENNIAKTKYLKKKEEELSMKTAE